MDRMSAIKEKLDEHRKLVAIGAAGLVFLLILAMARGVAQPEMSVLYSGLDDAAAGEVIASLETQGTPYNVRGGTIYVPKADRDMLRMRLAGEGLPKAGTQGYELLDTLNGFATTSQMFDVAYWRAKEGELARTIVAMPQVEAARVHISVGEARPFAQDVSATAAVTVTTRGSALNARQVQALRYLVSSAVRQLSSDDVAIIDGTTGLVSGQDDTPASDTQADNLRAKVQRLLDAHLGYGNAVVELTLDTVLESESITERRIDPESRVAISSDVQETITSSQDSGNAQVTIASDLPDGDAGQNSSSASETNETRTLTNFELSETTREVIRAPGAIKRMTVAVLVNSADPSAEDMEALEALVASAVGYDAGRGDVITLRAMTFEEVPEVGTLVSDTANAFDPMRLAQIGILSVVALILGLFVVRPALVQKSLPVPAPAIPLAPPPEVDLGEIPDAPVDKLKQLMGERHDESLKMLQHWIERPEGART